VTHALTLGVVGHVDHGKSALVRALTGAETDRLQEERMRGLSIVLGFAFLETPFGVIDLIDVPGHEDFVRAMIAGATALDGIVLCVAANEGVMPQTVEHLNIARLLGVTRGFSVLTKTDLVTEDELALAREDLADLVRETFLEHAAVLEVSTASGVGISSVRDAIGALAAPPVERRPRECFFLPLDRAFTLRGFGLVVTGTLRDGALKVGDEVELMPARRRTTVRALQNHGRQIDTATPGQRVAVNLRQLGKDDVEHGAVLASPGTLTPTQRLDVELELLREAPRAARNGAVLRFLTGTTEANARLRLLDRRELAPGETALAQLTLDREIATPPNERFLVRRPSPARTIGGGRILDVNPPRHRRFDARVTARLATSASGDVEKILAQRLEQAGPTGVGLAALAAELGVDRTAFAGPLAQLSTTAITPDIVAAADAYDALLAEILAALERFHREQPLKQGLDATKLAQAMSSSPSPEVLHHAVRRLAEQKKIRSTYEVLSLAGHDPFATLSARERKTATEIEQAFRAAGLDPPAPAAVVGADRTRQNVYRLLLDAGRLVRLRTLDRSAQLVMHGDVVDAAHATIARQFPQHKAFLVKDVRDLLHATRKTIVPLLEHFDAIGATVRSGDQRRLRERQRHGGE
jgi:selenocysteine-specific elongation factor